MALPWLIGAALIGVATVAASSSSSERSDNSASLKRKREEEEKSLKQEDIASFKSKSKDMIERKYKQKITFAEEKLEIVEDDNSILQELKNRIEILKSDNEKMKELIKQLEEAKNVV